MHFVYRSIAIYDVPVWWVRACSVHTQLVESKLVCQRNVYKSCAAWTQTRKWMDIDNKYKVIFLETTMSLFEVRTFW